MLFIRHGNVITGTRPFATDSLPNVTLISGRGRAFRAIGPLKSKFQGPALEMATRVAPIPSLGACFCLTVGAGAHAPEYRRR